MMMNIESQVFWTGNSCEPLIRFVWHLTRVFRDDTSQCLDILMIASERITVVRALKFIMNFVVEYSSQSSHYLIFFQKGSSNARNNSTKKLTTTNESGWSHRAEVQSLLNRIHNIQTRCLQILCRIQRSSSYSSGWAKNRVRNEAAEFSLVSLSHWTGDSHIEMWINKKIVSIEQQMWILNDQHHP